MDFYPLKMLQLMELCLIMQWFNPAIWLMREELQAIHEYEADEAVLNGGVNAREYQLLLPKFRNSGV